MKIYFVFFNARKNQIYFPNVFCVQTTNGRTHLHSKTLKRIYVSITRNRCNLDNETKYQKNLVPTEKAVYSNKNKFYFVVSSRNTVAEKKNRNFPEK